MKTRTKLIMLLASVTLLTACGNNQKPKDSFTNNKEPQTTQTTQSTETSKPTETTETTEQQPQEVTTEKAYVVNYSDYMETYHPQLGGTYPTGTKAFVYNYMQGKNQSHTAVIPLKSYDAGIAIFESQREATLFTQWLNSVNDKNTMTYNMQTNLDYFYTNVYTNY